jgi:enterochelin esterase family protein
VRDLKILSGFVTVTLLAVSLGAQAPQSPSPAVAQGAGRGGGRGAAVRSPEVSADRRVTFRLRAPNARDVSVTGLRTPLPMAKDETGVWTATTEALDPDIYEYRFSVDGATFADPGNPDGSASMSLVYVPGAVWSTRDPNVPQGSVARYQYQSPLMKGIEEFYVYAPPNYNARRSKPYPLLVVLHGLGDTAPSWIVRGGANLTMDNLIAQGKAEPMIVVSPHAQGSTGNAAAQFPDFVNALLTEILPQVRKIYNVSSNRVDQAVTGLSMGAAESLLFLNHLDQFAWIGSFSPGFDMFDPAWGGGRGAGTPATPNPAGRQSGAPAGVRMRSVLASNVLPDTFPRLDATANSKLKLLYIVCGTADDHLELTRQFKRFLDERNVAAKYVEVPDAGHVWPLWRAQLAQMAQVVFK